MSSESFLNNWTFLIGKWETIPETLVGDQPGTTHTMEISHFPSKKYIQLSSSSSDGSKGLNILFYDEIEKKLKMKAFYGFGFVNNCTESESSENKVSFDIVTDSKPVDFGKMEFKTHLEKNNNDQFTITIEMNTDGSEFSNFWKGSYKRLN